MRIARELRFNHLQKLLKLETAPSVQIGFPENKPYPSRPGVTVPQVAAWNEYGNPDQNRPERAFIRKAFKDSANHINLIKQLGRKIVRGEIDMDAALDILGKAGVKAIRKSIDSGSWPKLSQETVRKKGHSKPLVDTKLMYDSVSYERFK